MNRNPNARARDFVGRRIVAYRPGTFSDGRGGWAHRPELVLDNGCAMRFVVEETEVGEYGVCPILTPRPGRK